MYRIFHLELKLNKIMEELFNELLTAHNEMMSLSYEDGDDVLCFNAAHDCAIKRFNEAFKKLKEYCITAELRAQAGGVM